MSFQITKPGEYDTTDASTVQVQYVDGKYAFGFSDIHPRIWYAETGNVCYGLSGDSITGVHREPPTPPEGFQLMPRDTHRLLETDKATNRYGNWGTFVEGIHIGMTAVEFDERYPAEAPFYIASPITKPFRISDHGPGRYQTRDGKPVVITGRGRGVTYPWEGYIDNENLFDKSWKDSGEWQNGESQMDLVRYIGPLEPQPEWVATNEWRDRVVGDACGWAFPEGACQRIANGAWKYVVREQRWTSGDREEWRTIPVVQP